MTVHRVGTTSRWQALIRADLDKLVADGLERHPATYDTAQCAQARTDQGSGALFCSSNYLGLSTHPVVIAAAAAAAERFGCGAGGSRLTTGSTVLHRRVERQLAQFLGYPEAMLFATGYQANVSVIPALALPGVTILSDAQNHASLIDGCRLGRAPTVVIPHSDPAALDRALARTSGPAVVVAEGVYSMSGDLCPLAGIAGVAHRHGALLVVDDAHGIGTVGIGGRGIASTVPAASRPDVLIGTASKALGVEGAFICCSESMARFLRHHARGYVFSTAPTPMTVAAIGAAIATIESEPEHFISLRNNIDHFGEASARAQLPMAASRGPIFCVRIGDTAVAMAMAAELARRGFLVSPIRYPTVPRNAAMLRVCLMATHTRDQIDGLVDGLRRVLSEPRDAGASMPADGDMTPTASRRRIADVR
ncbi:8-amino-7-oxononanoate synthase [Propionibacterium freudenreichii]|uniref:aminotransferase class I/II-fold pyridoxal phosphate-dependent enzyme n=1 Tax=Propionibacterium freudenreichii TaxID=1744 RepID=UPI000BC32645|nr:8-amino-7-oxononanoate synthase [Propionibacterium freudenreichii]MDK9295017.1 8-amino-7-oxononanoate synthase [Propionibacterium freudenreichii]MDK9360385.1 8-amino-7-oxononanoate synthase [Propionibacterium freudenreichii]MDK9659947.1 8-amino-7-oxononanoate synthase [Propionibacterium freudenreichii]SCQ76816.1 Putative aminotransferase biotin synthesis related protein [Propionibacterium freudenreichii]SCQ83386.1 Putative aminotransferase biotin synthesis related protein [Propionibacterium